MNTTNTERWEQLLRIAARLRGADGCPWDRAQTLESMRSCVLEECWEVIEAINRCDLLQLQQELGDLLLNILLLLPAFSSLDFGKSLAQFFGILAGMVFNFIASKYYVFAQKSRK